MSMSRIRSRVAVIAGALPVLLAGSPVTPAIAAGEYTVDNLVANAQVVGPNAGFLGHGTGVTGTTPIFKITAPSTGSTITGVKLTLTNDNTAFTLARDLSDGDGLALYADVDGGGSFSAKDKAEGLRSAGFSPERPDASGNLPIRLSIPTAATGFTTYYVTIRPNTAALSGQKIRFEVPAAGVTGSAGDGPGSIASTPLGNDRMVIDSKRPSSPARSAFTVDENVAGEQDAYLVAPSAGSSEAGLDVVFFNSPTDTALTNILTRTGFNPATPFDQQYAQLAFGDVINPSAPTQPNEILIGDGTGIAAGGATVAKNNQVSNAVYARLLDTNGNLSDPPAKLTDCTDGDNNGACDAASASNPWNGNNVVAPPAPTGAILRAPTTGINLANQAAAPVLAQSATDVNKVRTPSGATAADTSTMATKSLMRIARVGADGQPDLTKATPNSSVAYVVGSTTVSLPHDINTTATVPEGAAYLMAWNSDDLGNISVVKLSAPVQKDITRPTVAVELSSAAAQGSTGDIVTLQFSEPMKTADITPTAPIAATDECNPEQPSPQEPSSVSKVLPVMNTEAGDRIWGLNNCFTWSPGGTSATIRLGTPDPSCVPTTSCTLPGVGDKVTLMGILTSTGAPRLRDNAGNQVLGIGGESGNNSGYSPIVAPPPRPDEAFRPETRDANADGVLDGVLATFTTNVDLNTFAAAQPNFSVFAGGVSEPITTAEYISADHKKVLFSFGGNFGTGVVPEVRLKSSGPGQPTGFVGEDLRAVPAFSVFSVDRAAPQMKSARTGDSNNNGRIDQVIVTFSEQIDHGKDHNFVDAGSANVVPGGYRVVGYENIGTRSTTVTPAVAGNRNRATPNPATAGTFSDTKTISLLEITTGFDTHATPIVQYFPNTSVAPGGDDRAWYDSVTPEPNKGPADPISSSQTIPSVQMVAVDAVSPRIVERKTGDLDVDGRIDTIDLKFSEPIPTLNAFLSKFTVANRTIGNQSDLGVDGIRLPIDETAPRGRGDTGAKPLVQYLGGMSDGLGNATPAEAAGVASTDGAPPAIVGGCVSSTKGNNGLCPEDDPANDASGDTDKGNKLNIFFSELIVNANSAPADYKVEQPQGTDKMTPAPQHAIVDNGTGETGFSIVTLTWTAANTLNTMADVNVRLTGNNVIDDRATPVNKSVQVNDVVAFAFPTVDLTLTCPVAATAGSCSQLTVNLNTNSSSGVSLWRLATTARATTPPDSEFTSGAVPTTYTFPAEGQYTLYLSGKDAYGRLSAEDSAQIRILKTPTLKNVQFVNSTPNVPGGWAKSGTVTDGDNLFIGADAYGTDAAEWASASTGGGCFAQNMSIDVRAITGKSNLGTVAPVKCDLKTSGEGPFRQMQFPVFKTSNTTRYPVGTVLKISDSDPGSMIVDGPGGVHRRRAFISVAARRSWMISDASVIKVPSTLVNGIPRLTPSIGYRDGALLRASTGYYLVYRNQKRPVSTTQLRAWRIPTTIAYRPTSGELRAMSTGSRLTGTRHPAGTYIKYSNGAIYQVVRNKSGVNVRRKLSNVAALKTLVPTSHIIPALSADSQMPVDSWLLGYRDGTLLKHTDGSFSVVARRSLRRFANPATFNSMGFNASNALGANGGAMPRVSGQGYRTGVAIDRYKITSVVIKVTNKAGGTATVTITPALGGLFALGTFDPAPSGWDFTR